MLGHSGSLAYEPWPEADESLLVQSSYNLPVQVRWGWLVPPGWVGRAAGRRLAAAGARLPAALPLSLSHP